MASTMDITLYRELFGNLVRAADILDVDAEFAGKLEALSQRLPEFRIGSEGQLQEWFKMRRYLANKVDLKTQKYF